MPATSYGRLVFGASAILFGIIALMWHDADTWQTPYRLLTLPGGGVVGDVLMVAQIAGGVAVLLPRSVRFGSIILSVVYAVFSIVAVHGIIAHPTVYVEYGGFFEQFALVCGAVALYAATEADPTRSATLGRTARFGLGLCAVSFTLAQIAYFKFTASLVPTWIPPSQAFWTVLTTVAFGLAAVAILINIRARLALRLMALMLALFGILIWVPMVLTQPGVHGNWSEFALNFQITGAAVLVADLRAL